MTRRLATTSLALTLSLVACVPAGTGARTGSPTSLASGSKTAAPVVKASATGLKPALLARPAGLTTVFKGRVSLDANYIVSQGGGVISSDGAGVISSDGAGVISSDGAGVISSDGAGLVTTLGNAVISSDGAGLIGDQAGAQIARGSGNVISSDGAGVISSDGAGVISSDGAGVISSDGAGLGGGSSKSRRVLQAATPRPAPTLPIGQALPVGGMQVRVFSLETGKPLSLGVDPSGKPAGTVLTNRAGEFEVYLPASVGGSNVRVVAATRLPGKKALRYDLITGTDHEAELDEDTQLISRYMQEAYVSRVRYLFERDADQLDSAFAILPGADIEQLRQRSAGWRAAVQGVSAAEREARYLAAAQLLLGAKKTSIFEVTPMDEEDYYGAERLARLKALFAQDPKAVDVLRDVLKRVRRAVSQRLAYVQQHDPNPHYREQPIAYLDDLPVVQEYRRLQASSSQPGARPLFHITNGTDLCQFVVQAYLSSDLTACAEGETSCDPFDRAGLAVGSSRKIDGIARLLEGAPPELLKSQVPANLLGLYIAAPDPAAPPQLGIGYTGPGALSPDVALPRDLTWGLDYGSRAIGVQLLVSMLFTSPDSWDADERALHTALDAVLGATF